MHEIASNSALIRIVLIILILVVPQIVRAVLQAKKAKSAAGTGVNRGTPLGDALREALRKSAEQSRMRRGEAPLEAEPLRLNEQFDQPPKIEPESSFFPSILLLALLVCLCLMAYRYWAG
jgi:hypothetical protein